MVISGLLPVPRAGEDRNERIDQVNVWLTCWCSGERLTFLDQWDLFWDKGVPEQKGDGQEVVGKYCNQREHHWQ